MALFQRINDCFSPPPLSLAHPTRTKNLTFLPLNNLVVVTSLFCIVLEPPQNLKERMSRMKQAVNPVFSDITWGAGGSTSNLSMELATYLQQTGHNANLHMTCTNIAGSENPVADIQQALVTALSNQVTNIVALRGDPPAGETEWKQTEGGFSCALDLVKFIRQQFGTKFGICVAGYPEGHPVVISEVEDVATLSEAEVSRSSTRDGKTYTCLDADYANEMAYLKQKVDAGADFIITQMFFDTAVYHRFVKDCRTLGITVPIVPGLMCINAYAGFVKMTGFCKTRVPVALQERMNALEQAPKEEMQQFGIEYGVQMCKELLAGDEPAPVLHFYTLNLENVVYGILEQLELLADPGAVRDETDFASQVATGSAWARVGDVVTTEYGRGTVEELDAITAKAAVRIESWADRENPVAYLEKGEYKKVFA